MIYLVISDDCEDLSLFSQQAKGAIQAGFDMDAEVFGPFHFAWNTGLAFSIGEEARVSLASYAEDNGITIQEAVKRYVAAFKLEEREDALLLELSGGWAKYVLYTLYIFSAPKNRPLLLVGVGQYLDDNLLAIIITELQKRLAPSFLLELDPAVWVDHARVLTLLAISCGSETEYAALWGLDGADFGGYANLRIS